MNTIIRDIEQHICFLKSREKRLEHDIRSYSPCHIERQICIEKLKDFEKSKDLLIAFNELNPYDISNPILKELVINIWHDVESLCPWGNRQNLKIQKLRKNIIMAKHYNQFTSSRFYKLLSQKIKI